MQQKGARRPYVDTRAISLLVVVVLSIAVVAALWLHVIEELAWWGPRAAYFLYAGLLLVTAFALGRYSWIAWSLLVLAVVELSWGLGSFVLQRNGWEIASLLPDNVGETQRFQWHPLLQAIPIPSLKIRSSGGLAISHTSAGTRGREPTPRDIEGHVVVATYGGSSTYDVGLGEGDTWSDRLADALGRDGYFVVNNGVPGYTTVEHVVQTSFYQDKFGRTPHCAIYYVGWNDLRNAHIPHLDPAFADFHLVSQVDSLKLRRVGGSNVTVSPALTLLTRLVGNIADTVHYPDGTNPYGEPMGNGEDPVLAADFERNVRTISAINRARGVATIWVGQLVNRAAFTGEGRYGWLPLLRDRDVPTALQRLNERLARTALELGDASADLPSDLVGNADFVDNGHFSVRGARRFSEALLPTVRDACR